jgi:hypothetical protein
MVLAVFTGTSARDKNESTALAVPAVAAPSLAAKPVGTPDGIADAHVAAAPVAAVVLTKPRAADGIGELPNGLGTSPDGPVVPTAAHAGAVVDSGQGVESADAAAAVAVAASAAAANATNGTIVGKGGKANATAPAVPPVPRQENIFTTLTNKIKSLEINQSLLSRYLEDANERCVLT